MLTPPSEPHGGPAQSSALKAAILIASVDAMLRRKPTLGVDVLLLALLDDAASSKLLDACWVDSDFVRAQLESMLAGPDTAAPGFFRSMFDLKSALFLPARKLFAPVAREARAPDPELVTILEQARQNCADAGQRDVSGAAVISAICGARACAAGELLRQCGATRFAVCEYLANGPWSPAQPPPVAAGCSHVMVFDDALTPMELVADILEAVFNFERARAVNLTLRVHRHGRASCGVFPHALADQKIAAIVGAARAKGHALRAGRA
ncbi:MAG: ATP-dependent Clp protease adaptor ClpS [Pseudomonadota bacterium]